MYYSQVTVDPQKSIDYVQRNRNKKVIYRSFVTNSYTNITSGSSFDALVNSGIVLPTAVLICTVSKETYYSVKETYYSVKRDLLQCQKRPTTVSKETYYSVKETYYSVKRDLLQCQKRPTTCAGTCRAGFSSGFR